MSRADHKLQQDLNQSCAQTQNQTRLNLVKAKTLHLINILKAVKSTKIRFSSKAQQIFKLPHHPKVVFMVVTMFCLILLRLCIYFLQSIISNNYYFSFFSASKCTILCKLRFQDIQRFTLIPQTFPKLRLQYTLSVYA